MYPINENSRTLCDGTTITTYSREITNANVLEAEAGTTIFRKTRKLRVRSFMYSSRSMR